MEKQTTIFTNESRKEKLVYHLPKRLGINVGEGKEYLTANGKVITVSRKRELLSGVGSCDYYIIQDEGKIVKPLQKVGVINYLRRN